MYKDYIKRGIDIVLCVLAIPVVLLIFAIILPMVYIEDKGPVFYYSNRVGKNGKIFKMIKIRSMKVNAPNILNPDGSTYNSEQDNRQTKVGRIIRKLSIDELPQIFNILKGEMSIIGPRPVLDTQLASFTDEEKGKLKVLPGLTGYTQAYCRNDLESHEERMLDAWYASNVSLFLDIKIFFKTIDTVLHPNRIYKNH